ncbi:LEAF RUST 10 DISEASE-RESISTANCE LOCUS RECEPTOR-LIKE PROTEIN KINASE-like 2.1 [Herrania umbratica]|uniref:LEAF RUST 10 DISEASE-RESISTANCE LOCUS RECEPTOR-LIKE PROTEIN KINASE-like 2.1 n=1 Tax=Herrania umbratica TaxID=108875 RepID=A0A6J1BB85_9ROSI|nr:LEAF RUST 10 DISEASE-RESISTANCE LOCUS RECEPTOR-LIKE PROTEIN KINASE-like 2.1 [Herrania umbratica]
MSASAMHHLHITVAFLFVLLVTIFLSIQAPVCLGSDYEKFAGCNKTFHCGIIENISYPFRQRGSPEYCGQPGFELICEDGKPMITIMSQSYQILEFNMSLRALTVARTDYLYSLCPKHLVNTSLGPGPFHSAWNNKQIILYYGCRSSMANQSTELSDRQFHCTMNGTDVVGYFAIPSALGNLSATVNDALASCRSSVIVPAFASVVQYLEYNSNSTNLNVALANGFGLEWRIANDSPGSSDGINLKLKLIIGLAVAAATIIVASVVVVTFRLKKVSLSRGMFMNFNQGKRNDRERIEAFILQYGSDLTPKRYSYADIMKITKSFKDELGQGGFGAVYKGKLPDGRLVAVKVLRESKGDGEEFINEVASISRTSHVNIVPFLGFCYEGSMRALIYEFMPNGSLDKFICHQGLPREIHHLELKTLYDIAIGIARGLEYLHGGCNTRILHFDIKPHNILLDENFCPKISDFGLAKLCELKQSMLSMISTRGTIGYIAPEFLCRSFGRVSHKSDVYSYGMMILEMFGEKKNAHIEGSQASEMNFPSQIYEHLEQGADLNRKGITVEDEEITRKMIIVSLWCVQTNPSDRPSMTKVLEMLQGSIQSLETPPRPFLYSPERSPENLSTTTLFSQTFVMDNSESEFF